MDAIDLAAAATRRARLVADDPTYCVCARWCSIRGWCLKLTNAEHHTAHIRIDEANPSDLLIDAAMRLALLGWLANVEPALADHLRVG